jgi:hypothetical protein
MHVRERIGYYTKILPTPVFLEFNYRYSFLHIQAPFWYNRDPDWGSEYSFLNPLRVDGDILGHHRSSYEYRKVHA